MMQIRKKRNRRKYLDDIGVIDRPDTWNEGDKREKEWERDRNVYGFDERETWSLQYSFYLWLYERLKMFVAVCGIDLNYHKFQYAGKEYTQMEIP